MEQITNSWGHHYIRYEDYKKLISSYNLQPFKYQLPTRPLFNRRDCILASKNFDKIMNCLMNNKSFAIITGFGCSGPMHFGSKLIIDQIRYYQTMGCYIFVSLADIEGYTVRKNSLNNVKKNFAEYLTHLKTLGLQTEKCDIYLQSNNAKVLSLGLFLSKYFDLKDFEKHYGRPLSISEIISSLIMMGDLYYPYSSMGYNDILVVMGLDEIKHIVFATEISVLIETLRLPQISATFSLPIRGLENKQMGKSQPEVSVTLLEPSDRAEKKILEYKTEEGCPKDCLCFQLLAWHLLEDDEEVTEIETECANLKRDCEECKRNVIEFLLNFLEKYRKEYEKNKEAVFNSLEGKIWRQKNKYMLR